MQSILSNLSQTTVKFSFQKFFFSLYLKFKYKEQPLLPFIMQKKKNKKLSWIKQFIIHKCNNLNVKLCSLSTTSKKKPGTLFPYPIQKEQNDEAFLPPPFLNNIVQLVTYLYLYKTTIKKPNYKCLSYGKKDQHLICSLNVPYLTKVSQNVFFANNIYGLYLGPSSVIKKVHRMN